MDFLSTDRSTFSRQARLKNQRRGGDGLFGWTIVIVILMAMTAFSWIFCMYVFGHPETAFNYNILQKVDKLPELTDYETYTAPKGNFLTPKEIYARYYTHSAKNLRGVSDLLRRQYIENFLGVNRVPYLKGTFKVLKVRELEKGDFFPSGLVVRAQAEDYPNVIVEHVLPAEEVPEKHYDLQLHNILELGTSSTCAAIINVERVDDERICFTTVPLVYGPISTPADTKIQTAPPARLNLYGKLPLTEPSEKETSEAAIPAPEPEA